MSWISLDDTEATEPVRFTFFWVAYPTTTTSSSFLESSSKVTLKLFLFPIGRMTSLYPKKLTTNVCEGCAFNWKAPSMSVIVPCVVPWITTLAPIIGSPDTSYTLPVTVFSCAYTAKESSIRTPAKKMRKKFCFCPFINLKFKQVNKFFIIYFLVTKNTFIVLFPLVMAYPVYFHLYG